MPKPGSVWRHHSGTEYTVIDVTSEPESHKADKFPITVFYRGPDGRKWPRTIESFLASFTLVRKVALPDSFRKKYPPFEGKFLGVDVADLERDDLLSILQSCSHYINRMIL